MHFERFYDDAVAHASYLVGDEHSGLAAIIDPKRDVDIYLDAARARGLSVRYAVLTRVHSGFVTGHIELRERVGAEIVVSRASPAEYQARRVADGEVIELGLGVQLSFLETPGATRDGISCVVTDRSRGQSPWGAFTGDTLPVDAVPRVDLAALGGRDLETETALLHLTLHEKLLSLPDSTRIYPARGFAPHAARIPLPPAVTAIGQQRATNPVLRLPLRSFHSVSAQAAVATQPPAYAAHVMSKNAAERPSLESILEDVAPLGLEQVIKATEKGALLVDSRPSLEHLLGHPRGSLAVSLEAHFGPWVGTLVDPSRPVILLAPEGRALESAITLARVGFDSVWGYLRDGIFAYRDKRPDLVARSMAISPVELSLRREAMVIDVRTTAERELRRITGSVHIPLHELERRAPSEVARDKLVVLASERGDRSTSGASILERLGYARVGALLGGMNALEEQGHPLEGLLAVDRRIPT